jgi:hypothetical protein
MGTIIFAGLQLLLPQHFFASRLSAARVRFERYSDSVELPARVVHPVRQNPVAMVVDPERPGVAALSFADKPHLVGLLVFRDWQPVRMNDKAEPVSLQRQHRFASGSRYRLVRGIHGHHFYHLDRFIERRLALGLCRDSGAGDGIDHSRVVKPSHEPPRQQSTIVFRLA